MKSYENIAKNEFVYEYTEQPHLERRKLILKKYPEIKQLMRCKGNPEYIVVRTVVVAAFLFLIAYWISAASVSYFLQTLLGVVVGSTLSAFLFMAMHEAVHGLVFGPNHTTANFIFGCLVNLPLVIPFFCLFRKHHRQHHKYLGDRDYDVEYPSIMEAQMLNRNAFTKFIWVILWPIIMNVRFVLHQKLSDTTKELVMNFSTVILFDVGFCMAFGGRGVLWLALCFWLSGSINVVGLWNISVHTLFYDQEDTYSYYGWLNSVYLNFGYHMEHHDFPNIPSQFLPEVKKIAPEFYCDGHHVDSLLVTVLKFIHDPKTNIFSRLKRLIPSLHSSG